MKFTPLYVFILITFCCCNNNTHSEKLAKDSLIKPSDNIEYLKSSLAGEFKSFSVTSLADTIKADLNGDKFIDLAFFTNNNNKRNILIFDGQTKNTITVGSDKSFGDMGNNFSWVDFWGTTSDKETYEIVIEDSAIVGGKNIKLENISIFVRKDEVGGGVITFKNNKYIWVHQAD